MLIKISLLIMFLSSLTGLFISLHLFDEKETKNAKKTIIISSIVLGITLVLIANYSYNTRQVIKQKTKPTVTLDAVKYITEVMEKPAAGYDNFCSNDYLINFIDGSGAAKVVRNKKLNEEIIWQNQCGITKRKKRK